MKIHSSVAARRQIVVLTFGTAPRLATRAQPSSARGSSVVSIGTALKWATVIRYERRTIETTSLPSALLPGWRLELKQSWLVYFPPPPSSLSPQAIDTALRLAQTAGSPTLFSSALRVTNRHHRNPILAVGTAFRLTTRGENDTRSGSSKKRCRHQYCVQGGDRLTVQAI